MQSKKILVIRFSAFGDTVLALRALRYVKKPGVTVHFLTKEKFSSLARSCVWVDQVHTIGDRATILELYRTVARLRRERFDVVVDLHSVLRSRFATIALGLPTIRARKPRLREWSLFLFKKSNFHRMRLRPIDRLNDFVLSLKKAVSFLGLETTISADDSLDFKLEVQSTGRKFIAIAADSAWKQKEWSVDHFQAIAHEFAKRGESVVWLGFKLPQAPLEGIQDLTGRTSSDDLLNILSQSKVLVCNDAGLMHMAEGVGTPVVAVFGPTVPELGFSPKNEKSAVVSADLWCRPCSKSGRYCFRLMNRRKCLDLVSRRRVVETVDAVLKVNVP